MDFTPAAMEKLVELLRPPESDVLQGEDLRTNAVLRQTTNRATNSKNIDLCYEITSIRNENKINEKTLRTPKTIEEFEDGEAKEAEKLGKIGFGAEDRKTPEYSMVYQQAVSPEDVFLQIGSKTPSSASCEHLIVKIQMPGDKRENVDLTVNTSSITVISSQHYLNLPLPHEIDPDTSKANWDSVQDTLVLTLKLKREFDYVNF